MADGFDMNQYLGVFLEEVEEHIESLEEKLVELEQYPEKGELVQSIFRSFHTIKGAAGSMNFQRMAKLAHLMENLLDGVRIGKIAISSSLIDTLLQGVDVLKVIREGIAEKGEEPAVDIQHISDSLKEFVAEESLKNGSSAEKEKEPLPQGESASSQMTELGGEYRIKVQLESECSMKGVRAYLVISRLQEAGAQVITTEPSLDDLESENFGQSFLVTVKWHGKPEDIKKLVESVAEVDSARVELLQAKKAETGPGKEIPGNKKGGISPLSSKRGLKKTVRVDVERLDNLLNLVGELVIDRARLEDILSRLPEGEEETNFRGLLSDTTTHVGRVTNELQLEIMKARMLPLAEVFNRFPRMVRDLARNSGKEVDFLVEGEETELDRSLLEEITDPLIHLLRNAIDHGIESKEEREALGKPARGTILLRAYQEENSVIIMIRDDGRGISLDQVKQKALARGLVTPEELAKMTDKEVIDFIFYPGFSTSSKVTDVSGRGVGMDIVKRNIERVNGQVLVETKEGQGSTFYLRLPLTLAIVRALLVRAGDATFAIPMTDIVEIEKVERKNTYWVNQVLTALFREKTLPLLRLQDLLQSRKATYQEGMEIPETFYTIVVNTSRVLAGLVVDEIMGEQEIVIKSLGTYIGDIRGLGGATILGDGSISLILDVASLLWKFSQVGG
ncbi:MAG: two-component system, chemotaxis family, sensor kinase CheA [Candidatus Atribacteria bacterium]|nr:two-component system, chemotaxis family, sensor kinase CheA [Candidatus Atribacteria bacterium]